MKKIYCKYLLFCFSFLLSACSEDIELGKFKPEEPSLNFITTSLEEVGEAGGEFDIELESNLPWRVKSNEDWITVEESTSYGNATRKAIVKVKIEKNKVLEPREGSITAWVTNDYEQEFIIKQVAGTPPPIVKRHVYVKENGQGNGSSWEDATSLSLALAEDLSAGDFIHIAAGLYAPSLPMTGGSTSESDKTFEVRENIIIIGGYPANAREGDISDPDNNITELTGNSQSNHVLMVTAPKVENQKVTITGITVKDGKALSSGAIQINGTKYAGNYGGGLIVGNSVLELNNCTIQSNIANSGAGGVYAFAAAQLSMNDCTVKNNSCVASGANGGGVFVDGGASLEMNGGYVANNSAGGFAGGVYVMKAACRIFNVTVEKNAAGGIGSAVAGKAYGGVYIREGQGVLVNCTISENTASNIGGGLGVYGTAASPAAADIISCTISENRVKNATALGGGIYVNAPAAAATVNVYNSIVSGNTRGSDGTNFVSDEEGASGYIVTNKNTIVSAAVIGGEGQEISTDFNFSTMLEKISEESITYYVLKGDNNPAKTKGMSTADLLALGIGFIPNISEEVMGSDQLGLSRDNKLYIGSCVK
ncbi:BACON domain-containing protein [Bacteroides gallinarum]|jgi:hypothetical protein|uniref:BACON domain-containing protein n=1 Tax=Bacteroides gallinarum TaxID=376806 RepID=UPI00035CA7D1|nr:BACON domain-containing carbohydrate-binding protein [Bacteroides gallinarum]